MSGADRRGNLPLRKVLLRARIEALVETATPGVVRKLERAIGSIEESVRPRRRKGRPALPAGTHRELMLHAELQKVLTGGRMKDKEAIERWVDVARPKASGEERRGLVKLWRSRLASARKKSRR